MNYKDSGNFFPGKISAATEMSPGAFLYTIAYDDGDSEDMVPRERVRLLGTPKRGGQPVSGQTSSAPAPVIQSKFRVGEEVPFSAFMMSTTFNGHAMNDTSAFRRLKRSIKEQGSFSLAKLLL